MGGRVGHTRDSPALVIPCSSFIVAVPHWAYTFRVGALGHVPMIVIRFFTSTPLFSTTPQTCVRSSWSRIYSIAFRNFIIGVAERVWGQTSCPFSGTETCTGCLYASCVLPAAGPLPAAGSPASEPKAVSWGFPHYQLAFHSVVSSQRSSLTQHPNSPGKGKGIPAPQTGGQFREICRQASSFLCIHQVRAKVLLWQELPSISPASGACTHELGWSEAGVF